jgi:hypothetical protein
MLSIRAASNPGRRHSQGNLPEIFREIPSLPQVGSKRLIPFAVNSPPALRTGAHPRDQQHSNTVPDWPGAVARL